MRRQKKTYIIYSSILTIAFLLFLGGGILKSNTAKPAFSSMGLLEPNNRRMLNPGVCLSQVCWQLYKAPVLMESILILRI